MYKKPMVVDLINRFGKDRVLKALTKRRFTNARRVEERKTGQKHMGFKKGGGTDFETSATRIKPYGKTAKVKIEKLNFRKKPGVGLLASPEKNYSGLYASPPTPKKIKKRK